MEKGTSDGDIFEITDFTNATPWESFIADLEDIFHQWGLAKSDYNHEGQYGGIQHRKTERISYSNRTFVVTLEVECRQREKEHRTKKNNSKWPAALHEMTDSTGDFPPRTHHLARWYGLSQVVIVCPTEGAESLHSQAQANLMLSSVSIAITNTGCTTPVFVQLHQPWRQVYVGMCDNGRVRTNFSVTHLHHTPPQFNHLSGLLDIFKSKLCSLTTKLDPVQVAIRYLYVLRHWSLNDWPVEPLGDIDKGFDSEYLRTLRVGAFTDPVKELHLSAIWPTLTEELVTDTGTYSDLNPTNAAVWTVSLHLTENASCILAETLLNFYQLCFRTGSVAEMLGKASLWDEESSGAVSDFYTKPLDRLTSPGTTLASPLFHSVVYTATQRMESGRLPEENLTERDLDAVIKFLFPDAYDQDSTSHSATQVDSDLVFKLKSAPLDSLTGRLAKALAIVNTECGVKAMCRVWHEVSLQLRERWENGILLPHVPEGPPDMKCCLLHQKLQMLNCCVRHKITHQQHRRSKPPHKPTPTASSAPHLSSQTAHSVQPTPTPPNVSSTSGNAVSSKWDVHISSTNATLQSSESSEGAVVGNGIGRQAECEEMIVEQANVLSSTSERGNNSSDNDDDEFFEALEDQEEEKESESHFVDGEDVVSHTCTEVAGREREERGGGETERKEADGRIEQAGDASVGDLAMGERDVGVTCDSSEGRSGEGGEGGDNCEGGEGREGGEGGGAMGRLRLCGNLVLVATGEPMYIPVTQDHAPLTEDHVWEQQAVMARLGTSEEAARLRARMQSSSLLSDMQAFKAANPGCLLEDFVRWYSPRDWVEGEEREGEEERMEGEGDGEGDGVEGKAEGEGGLREGNEAEKESRFTAELKGEEDEEGWGGDGGWGGGEWGMIHVGDDGTPEGESSREDKTAQSREKPLQNELQKTSTPPEKKFVDGHLSLRMRQPGSLWSEVWSGAEPVPAHRQKKLFDDTREAEKVLHYLAGLKTAELGLLVLPVLIHCAIHALKEKHGPHPLSASESHLEDAIALLSSIPHPTPDTLPKYREVISLLSQIEHLQAAAYSLQLKLSQGLDLSGGGNKREERGGGTRGGRNDSEISASVEVLLQEPELVLQDPTSSLTGQALQGLLVAEVSSRDLEEQELSRKKIRVSPHVFPPPSGREFILRSTTPHPSLHSLPTPHRMFCVLTPTEFRLAGAFTTDILIT